MSAAAVVILISSLTLGQAFALGVRIDWLSQGSFGQVFPGHMPTATAEVFLAFGLALVLLDIPVRRTRPAEFLSFLATLISLLALIGYAYSSVSFFAVPRRTLAFHTVFLMVAFSFAILAARPRLGLMSLVSSHAVDGLMMRRLLPAAVGIPVLVGWLSLEGQRGGLYPAGLTLPYFTLSIVVVFSTLIWLTAAALKRVDLERERAEQYVRELNAELEVRVKQRTAELENANRELETFSYSVSHDLRAPLRAISGFSTMVLDDNRQALDPRARDYLQRVVAASRRMGQLIDDLLNLSRITRHAIKVVQIDLSAIAEEVVAGLRQIDPARRIDVAVETGLRADADPKLVRIVLENLLGNAWKFTRTTAEPRVQVGAILHDGRTAFFVRDNGAGFDMAHVGKLFGAFQRLHAEAEFEGTGIGLATVQRIIHRHRGTVWAKGAVGAGATIYFTL